MKRASKFVVEPILTILIAIAISAVLGAVILFGICLTSIGARGQTIGPTIGLRIPVYDLACQAKLGRPDSTCYRYIRPDEAAFEVKPDPLNLSVGLWSARLLAAPGTNPEFEQRLAAVEKRLQSLEIFAQLPTSVHFNGGLMAVKVSDGPLTVRVDTGYIMQRSIPLPGSEPQPGTACKVATGVVSITTGGSVCYCVTSASYAALWPTWESSQAGDFVWTCGALVMAGPAAGNNIGTW